VGDGTKLIKEDIINIFITNTFDKNISEHVEIGKQIPLKKEWIKILKSSSLFARIMFLR
jgi:hypothetical protein